MIKPLNVPPIFLAVMVLMLSGAHKGKERTAAFHVNTNLLRNSALWLVVCMCFGFTLAHVTRERDGRVQSYKKATTSVAGGGEHNQ